MSPVRTGEAKESKTRLKRGKPRFSKPNAIERGKHKPRKGTKDEFPEPV
jgi:hypothetical protein